MTPLKPHLFLMDPYETLNLDTETSLLIIKELLSRGEKAYWTEEVGLSLIQDQVMIQARAVESVHPFQLGPEEQFQAEQFSSILIRKDPPFNISYYHLTLILDHLPPSLVQINPVKALRAFNEKLYGLRWPQFAPPTITTGSPQAMVDFLEMHGDIVIKPLEECSGRGIQRLRSEAPESEELIYVMMSTQGKGSLRYMTAQKFLPAIHQGDKRVFLLNGEPVGMVNRVPAVGSFLGNIHQGARCEATHLSDKEREIVQTLAPVLRAEGLFLVGLDLIGEQITEVNLTSPSALLQINQVMEERLEIPIVDAMLDYIQQHQALHL